MGKLLDGVTVIEMATFIAAPSTGRFLADLGANVIKIEAFAGDQLRYTAPTEGRPLNQYENTTWDLENANKRGIALNLKSDTGKSILKKLLDKADIFITNWRPDALARSKLEYGTLHAQYPSLVYASCTGYGDDGPDKDLPGFDFTSFLARGGYLHNLRPQGSRPMVGIPGLGDHNVGMVLAAGILAALYHAKATGKGEMVTTSLFQTAVFNMGIMIQAEQYPDYGKEYPIDVRDAGNPMLSAWETKDGRYIQTCMPNYDVYYEPLMKALGRTDLLGNERYFPIANMTKNKANTEVYDIIAGEIAKKTVEECAASFKEFDVPFSMAQTWLEILDDKQAWANNFFYKMKYDNGSEKTLVRPPLNFKEMGLAEYKRGPLLGEHGPEVLKELGYSQAEVDRFLANKDLLVWQGDGKKA